MQTIMELFQFRRLGILTPSVQIILIISLYILTTLLSYWEYQMQGTMLGYPLIAVSMLFVPIYEELIFRGFILGWQSATSHG